MIKDPSVGNSFELKKIRCTLWYQLWEKYKNSKKSMNIDPKKIVEFLKGKIIN